MCSPREAIVHRRLESGDMKEIFGSVAAHRTLFLLLSSLFIISHAQAHGEPLAVRDEPRPLAILAEQLEHIYGWPITYEDAPLSRTEDLIDVTEEVCRTKCTERIYAVRPIPVEIGYEPPSTQVPDLADFPKVLKALEEIVRKYNRSYGANVYRVVQEAAEFHIVPVNILDSSGRTVPVTSILNTVLTVLPGQRTADDLLRELCSSLSSATQHKVDLGAGAGERVFILHNTGVTSNGESLRNILNQLTKELNVPLSWRMLYDGTDHTYALNIHQVVTVNSNHHRKRSEGCRTGNSGCGDEDRR
jgi:hypothetical protein